MRDLCHPRLAEILPIPDVFPLQSLPGSRKGRTAGTFDVQVSASCNRNSDGTIIGLLFAFVDISGRKRAQTAEREAERNRAMKESLLAACYQVGNLAASVRY